jgi:hypothetical protein
MKFVVLAAALILGFAQQPAKPAGGSVPAKSNSAHVTTPVTTQAKSDITTSPAASSVPATTAPSPSDSASSVLPANSPATRLADSDLEIKLMWFIGALAVVAVLQFITLLWQAVTVRKMLGRIAEQAYQMEYQSTMMAGQLTALQDTASAARLSATAAKETVDVIVSKERARLRIDLAPFYLNFGAPSPANYAVQLQGKTDAFVLDSHAAVYVSDSREPDPNLENGKPMPLPNSITPQSPVVKARDVLHPFSDEEIESIRQRKSFVHFSGFVRYKDVFDGEHETRFNRVWSIAKMNNLGDETFTYWEHCGGENANLET